MNREDIKVISQYELHSAKGSIPPRLSPWIEGVYRNYTLSNGLSFLFADFNAQQTFDLSEVAGPGVYFTFMTSHKVSDLDGAVRKKCAKCQGYYHQLTQTTVLEQSLNGVTRLKAQQRMTCMQIFLPFSQLAKMLGVTSDTVSSLWGNQQACSLESGDLEVDERKVFPIYIDTSMADSIKAIRQLGLSNPRDNTEALLFHQSELLLPQLLLQISHQYK